MIHIHYMDTTNQKFWMSLDRHISVHEFNQKVLNKQGYVIFNNDVPVGILRYNLFWDNTPFCTMLCIEPSSQNKGFGKLLLLHWETEMKHKGFKMVMTSTQIDESAIFFYEKMGYYGCGGINIDIEPYTQPMEIIMIKAI